MSHSDEEGREPTPEEIAEARRIIRERREVLQREQAERAQLEAAQSAAETSSFQATLRRLEERAARKLAADQVLPCYPFMAAPAPDAVAGAEACRVAGAEVGCARAQRQDPSCPQIIARTRVEALADHLFACRIPGSIGRDGNNRLRRLLREGWRSPPPKCSAAELLLGTDPLFAAPALLGTEAELVVRAWAARTPGAEAIVSGRRVSFTGAEWGLFFGGECGVGKTFAACLASLLCRRSDGERERALFVDAPTLGERDATPTARECREAEVLIVDDLGTERKTEGGYAVDELNKLLTARQRDRAPTIVTTNMRRRRQQPSDPEGIEERYGERVAERLREGAVLVGFRGASLR